MRRRERSPRRGADTFEPGRCTRNREPPGCPMAASHRAGGAWQSAHRGGGVTRRPVRWHIGTTVSVNVLRANDSGTSSEANANG